MGMDACGSFRTSNYQHWYFWKVLVSYLQSFAAFFVACTFLILILTNSPSCQPEWATDTLRTPREPRKPSPWRSDPLNSPLTSLLTHCNLSCILLTLSRWSVWKTQGLLYISYKMLTKDSVNMGAFTLTHSWLDHLCKSCVKQTSPCVSVLQWVCVPVAHNQGHPLLTVSPLSCRTKLEPLGLL